MVASKHVLSYLAILSALLCVSSCETDVDNPAWPENPNRLIVVASIRVCNDDSMSVRVKVRRTLPLDGSEPESAGLVTDALVRVIPPHLALIAVPHVADGVYSSTFPASGEGTYALEIQWRERTLHGSINPYAVRSAQLAYDSFTVDRFEWSWDEPGLIYEYILVFYTRPVPNAYGHDCIREFWSGDSLVPYSEPPFFVSLILDGSQSVWTHDASVIIDSITLQAPRLYRLTNIFYSPEYLLYREVADNREPWGRFADPIPPEHNMTGDGIGFLWYEVESPVYEIRF